jgi:hypothetical protein
MKDDTSDIQMLAKNWRLVFGMFGAFVKCIACVDLCVLCGSQNKQPIFPYTTLTDWFV